MNRWMVLAVALCWLASLALPAAYLGPPQNEPISGLFVLLLGWLAAFDFQFAWFGNLVLMSALILAVVEMVTVSRIWRTTFRVIAGALVLFALDALRWTRVYSDAGASPVTAYGPGYYLWLVAMLGGAALLWRKARTGGGTNI